MRYCSTWGPRGWGWWDRAQSPTLKRRQGAGGASAPPASDPGGGCLDGGHGGRTLAGQEVAVPSTGARNRSRPSSASSCAP